MRTRKTLLITGAALLAAGAVICGSSFAIFGFDFKQLSGAEFVTNEYEPGESFENISIKGDTEDIVFEASEDGKCKVICYEDAKEPHDVRVEDDTLTIGVPKNRKWHFGIYTETPKITVYLPEKEYVGLLIDTDTGDVTISDAFTFGSVDMKLDTGDADIHDMTCGDLKVDLDTGDLKLANVIASGEFHIESDTGDVHFDGCDAETVYVETDTGDVSGTLLSDRVFSAKSDTGSVNVPDTTTGGRCEITTDTGDIKISVS